MQNDPDYEGTGSARLYRDYIYPTSIDNALQELKRKTLAFAPERVWLTQPRRADDPIWEILTMNFRQPSSIAEISFELLEIGAEFEFYYINRAGLRLPVLDMSKRHYTGTISSGVESLWFTFSKQVYPIVARSLEIRLRRVPDSGVSSDLKALGVRNLFIKRNVRTRQDAELPFENSVDPLGNLETKTVKDWDALKATDDNLFTYWKSEPQPTPDAVVCYYMDVRDENGNQQRIDRLYLDPVYMGASLNLYYSSDETAGTRRLNSVPISPSEQTNVPWDRDWGFNFRHSSSKLVYKTKDLGWPIDESFWIGLSWQPNFDSGSPPAGDYDLLTDSNSRFRIRYKATERRIDFLYMGLTFSSPAFHFTKGSILSLVAAVTRREDKTFVQLMVFDAAGNLLSDRTPNPDGESVTYTNTVLGEDLIFGPNGGHISSVIIKHDDFFEADMLQWQQDADYYFMPDPILSDATGRLPSVTTDGVILGGSLLHQEALRGGLGEDYFAEKEWTPIWRNWVTEKGYYYFPAPVEAKYFKLEFTDLTEEPYPIWESGIEVKYKSFPVHVIETAKNTVSTVTTTTNTSATTVTNTAKTSFAGTTSSTNRVTRTSTATSRATSHDYDYDIQITLGEPVITTDVPHSFDEPVETIIQKESAQSTLYNRSKTSVNTSVSTKQLAGNAYYTVVSGDWLIKIAKKFGMKATDWKLIHDANKHIIDTDPRVKRLPQRYPGWWIFPGQKIKIPTSIMQRITKTTTTTTKSTAVERKDSTTTRKRFTLTSTHRYDLQVAQRDMALAYFAGIREIGVFRLNYAAKEDTQVYNITRYMAPDFAFTNVKTYPSNAIGPETAGTDGVAESVVFNSMSVFKRIEVDTFDRGLRNSLTTRSVISPVVVVEDLTTRATWADDIAEWEDELVVWGADLPDINVSIDSNFVFQGQRATKFMKRDELGQGMVESQPFSLPAGARVRIDAQLFRLLPTRNTIKVQLINKNAGDDVLFEELIVPEFGAWRHYRTKFWPVGASLGSIAIRLVVAGPDPETLYIGSLIDEWSTIVYEMSNDGGANYYDITEVANRDNAYFVFPTLDNRLRVRVTMRQQNDYLLGIRVAPLYLN